ncbi:MAG: hypothetical protein FJ130_02170 [Deltaproteobacteria bacterium]|nr:hypothetical protein [Deltaproteobacteria bacterium]
MYPEFRFTSLRIQPLLLCFIPEASYHYFLSERLKEEITSGPILDREGNVLGKHKGIPFYTIGQRRGLRIAKGKPLYVIGIDREKNAVIVGEEREVYGDAFIVHSVNWIRPPQMAFPISCKVNLNVAIKREVGMLPILYNCGSFICFMGNSRCHLRWPWTYA